MGSYDFTASAHGTDVESAFHNAVDNARHEYGNRGYTGTVAEKDEYVVIESKPLGWPAARELVNKLMSDNDARISDKWGPAGAVCLEEEPGGQQEWLFFGWASS